MNAPARRPPIACGDRFGRLVVVHEVERDGNSNRMWAAVCDCGNKRTVRDDLLRGGRTCSCGCSRRTPLPPGEVEDEAASDDPTAPRSLTLMVTAGDIALLRALTVADGREPGDPGNAIIHLLRQTARNRGLHHVLVSDPSAPRRPAPPTAEKRRQGAAGAAARRKSRPTAAEKASHRAAAIEHGEGF